MSARDDYPILHQQERGGSVEAKKALDEIDRLRADKARLFSLATDEAERAAALSAQVAAVNAALDRHERVRPEHTYGLGNSCHSFVTAVAEALE